MYVGMENACCACVHTCMLHSRGRVRSVARARSSPMLTHARRWHARTSNSVIMAASCQERSVRYHTAKERLFFRFGVRMSRWPTNAIVPAVVLFGAAILMIGLSAARLETRFVPCVPVLPRSRWYWDCWAFANVFPSHASMRFAPMSAPPPPHVTAPQCQQTVG